MIPLIGVVGESGAGKTTLIVKLIRELTVRGFQVAAIKHSRHEVSMDQPGKDTALMQEAGATAVALVCSGRVFLRLDAPEPWTAEDIVLRLFPRADLVLVEGFREEKIPKIAVLRKQLPESGEPAKGVIAVVSDSEIPAKLPRYLPGQINEIADLLEDYIKRLGKKRDVKLCVNGKKIFIKPFIKDFFLKTISAMVESSKARPMPAVSRFSLTSRREKRRKKNNIP